MFQEGKNTSICPRMNIRENIDRILNVVIVFG